MVAGLERFVSRFGRFADSFVLIGGAACDLWMAEQALRFRATEDLDIVVVVDAVDDEFIREFWDFIREGEYATHQQSRERPAFYRFAEPKHGAHPAQIELLTRNGLGLPDDARFTPIPAGKDLSSLSAILMDSGYYDYVVNSRITINGIPTVPVQCLIPLKAKAYLDLKARRDGGDMRVRGDDIRIHRNDVFALAQTLAPDDRFPLSDELKGDLAAFLETLPAGSPEWQAITQSVQTVLGSDYAVDPEQACRLLAEVFEL